MGIDFWIVLWKALLIVGVGLFAIMAVVVSIGGAWDIRRLLRDLREDRAEAEARQSEDSTS